jgi:aldehyde dehydrogenase (NAD+)
MPIVHWYRTIEPTILLNPPLDSDVMTEEIFGPILPIITVRTHQKHLSIFLCRKDSTAELVLYVCVGSQVKKIEDSMKFVRSKPKPLAIYAFTRNEKLKSRIINETSSGSVTFNDAVVQVCERCVCTHHSSLIHVVYCGKTG